MSDNYPDNTFEYDAGNSKNEYHKALKDGRKYYNEKAKHGGYPYLLVLNDIVKESGIAKRTDLGEIDIPLEFVTGAVYADRVSALAGNFMPLLSDSSEFAKKWMHVYDYQLQGDGITDPITCFEYLGRFYVQEGNKRVSVLKYLKAVSIRARVTRIVPVYSEETSISVYYEFVHFYALTGLYTVDFNQPGQYASLIDALGLEKDHKWTPEERNTFNSSFSYFKSVFSPLREKYADITDAEALLAWLQIYEFSALRDTSQSDLRLQISALIPDILAGRNEDLNILSVEPSSREAGVIDRMMTLFQGMLNVAMIYGTTLDSNWTLNHDNGRKYIEALYSDKVHLRVYMAVNDDAYEQMENAVAEGAHVIFATMPGMMEAARRIALQHKNVKVLVCAIALPYAGVRMYYIRSYECRFIAGAIAGAMVHGSRINYTAHYPICGTIADINAFALGVSMTNPMAKVILHWSCVEGDAAGEGFDYKDYIVQRWNWGYFYETIIRSILDGSWNIYSPGESVNYWWGLNSRATDLLFSTDLPSGITFLGESIKTAIIKQHLDPFSMRITDQDGIIRNTGKERLSNDNILMMDWLCENIEGSIPGIEDIIPAAVDTVRILGIHKDIMIPKKEAQL